MTRTSAADKARTYLAEGRLIVIAAKPGTVTATCRGDGAIHDLGYRSGTWWCSCPCRTDQCAHLRALRLTTCPDLGDRP